MFPTRVGNFTGSFGQTKRKRAATLGVCNRKERKHTSCSKGISSFEARQRLLVIR